MATTPTEIELKLALAETAHAALRAHPALLRRTWPPAVRPATKHLINHYFDTRDRLLARHGMALRLRGERADADKKSTRIRWVQTLKTSGEVGGAMSARGEWEMPVAGPKLELARFADTPLAQLASQKRKAASNLPAALSKRMVRVFTTDFRRETWTLDLTGRAGQSTGAELVLDVGTIVAGSGRKRRTAPISEVEIELKKGSADALLKFALRLASDLALVPLPYSKAARGQALADAKREQPVKPRLPGAHASDAATRHLGRMIAACQFALLVNTRGFVAGTGSRPGKASGENQAEYVHQARVALRNLRSALRSHRSYAGRERSCELNAALRATGRALGTARDWAVFDHETLDRIEAVAALDDEGATAMTKLRAASAQALATAEAGLNRHLQSTDFAHSAIMIERFAHRMSSRPGPLVSEIAPRLLERQHRRVTALLDKVKSLDTEGRHRLRIEVKRLRYTFDMFTDLFEKSQNEVSENRGAEPSGEAHVKSHATSRVKPYRRALSDLQDNLGAINDMAVATRLFGGIFPPDPESGMKALKQRARELFEKETAGKIAGIAKLAARLNRAGRPWAKEAS